MTRRLLNLALGVALLPSSCFGQERNTTKQAYSDLVADIKSGNKDVDFRGLRFAYADLPSKPDTGSQKKAMTAALKSKSYAEALKNADTVLDGDYADMDAHFAEYAAHRELHHPEQAEFHRFVLQGLLDSITHYGDGKSFETAFQVIDVHEEYVVLHFMGLRPSRQSTAERNGHSFDILEAVNPKTNEKFTWYFNIDIEEKHLKEAFK